MFISTLEIYYTLKTTGCGKQMDNCILLSFLVCSYFSFSYPLLSFPLSFPLPVLSLNVTFLFFAFHFLYTFHSLFPFLVCFCSLLFISFPFSFPFLSFFVQFSYLSFSVPFFLFLYFMYISCLLFSLPVPSHSSFSIPSIPFFFSFHFPSLPFPLCV